METVEKKAFETLAEKPYTVTLGGRKFEFHPVRLVDRQEISAISSTIDLGGIVGGEENVFRDALAAGKYARQVAEIITAGAHVRGIRKKRKRLFGLFTAISEKKRREELFRCVYEEATIEEVYEAMKQIFIHAHPAFFLNITTSLSQQNILKPTKGTAATAPGQSKPQ